MAASFSVWMVIHPHVFNEVLTFVRDSGLYEVQVTFLTAFPNTPFYRRLKSEGRIIRDRAWDLCTLFDINFEPRGMDCNQLQSGFLDLVKILYSTEETQSRRLGFKRRLKNFPNFGRPRRRIAKMGIVPEMPRAA
jgi:radical SAM superfamily enzyme YgiQ (UPF0313 family)